MSIKKVYQSKESGGTEYEDSFLRGPAGKVEEINADIVQVIHDLRDTMWSYPFCVGLSANQIGYPYTISVVNPERKCREDDMVLINPEIVSLTGKKSKKRESCMSLWGLVGEVERRNKLSLEYRNLDFDLIRMDVSGFQSRVIQHEIDHLNGVLYSDRMSDGELLSHAEFFDSYSIIK